MSTSASFAPRSIARCARQSTYAIPTRNTSSRMQRRDAGDLQHVVADRVVPPEPERAPEVERVRARDGVDRRRVLVEAHELDRAEAERRDPRRTRARAASTPTATMLSAPSISSRPRAAVQVAPVERVEHHRQDEARLRLHRDRDGEEEERGDLALQRRRPGEEQEQRRRGRTPPEPTSTWPQTALSAITAGLKSTAAATSARTGHRSVSAAGAMRAASVPATQASARSARIAGSLRSR